MQALKDDPMFSWKPSIAVSRAVELQTREYGLSPGGTTSYAVISLTPHDKNLVHDLLKASVDAMARAGYSDKVPGLDGTRLGGQVKGEDFWIECMVSLDSTKFMGWPTSSTYGMLNIVLSGPYAKA
jgi:hypothetical protein